ncbi:hypothetical protein LSM04_006206 [Trypanosoma melophagium]|uniref:uncharacterized protein n=1 Tax=Trypanosoma melophagium TaxID=715481 RepID=UPI00351A4153|nr:hypothetical protein LSM04_006206 [Trypanosoma melophagium]
MSDGDVVATFMAINECSEEEAVGYLADANFDIGLAQSLYTAAQHHDQQQSQSQQQEEAQQQPLREAQSSARPPLGFSSPSELSNTGSPGYATPPYLMSRLDGGGGADRQEQFPAVPSSGQASLPYVYQQWRQQQQQQQRQSSVEADMASGLFPTPSFVEQGTVPFAHFCARALQNDQWVLLCLRGDDFKSFCVNRDVWCSERMSETVSMFCVYEVNVSTEQGEQLSHGYRVDRLRDIPVLLIINPLTTLKESLVPLNISERGIDANEVNEALLLFVAERGSPSQWEDKKYQRRPVETVSSEPQRQEFLVDDDNSNNNVVDITDDNHSPAVAVPPPVAVDITPYEVSADGKNAFALRCRLPNEQITLRLKPETPVQLLVDYLAYCAYKSRPEAYPHGVPKCSIKTGYPPREVVIKDQNQQVLSWGEVRSGDTVFLHIK